MANKTDSELLINSVELLDIQGNKAFPTALYVDKNVALFGTEAVSATDDPLLVNENFKLALGEIKKGKDVYSRQHFKTAGGDQKSAYELTKLFVDLSVQCAKQEIIRSGLEPATSVLISEPVAFHDHDNPEGWITSYRHNLRRILNANFDNVEFLPEPFAVFQYYRYGKRHPAVLDKKKYFALVIDFGGGTFDISIIETTREGDISQSGKHAKPLSSTSVPIGGFLVNRELAIAMIMETCTDKKQKDQARKQIDNHWRWKNGDLDFESLAKRNQNFLRAFETLCRSVEQKKCQLTGLIKDWRLDAPLKGAISINIASDPYADNPPETSYRLTAENFREVFVSQIWNAHLKRSIRSALKKAADSLQNTQLNVCLISGGSANIGWLTKLLKRDFQEDLYSATPISLSENYQHIVSKGLAVECARRKHDPDSEFVAVTYNPIMLLLSSNQGPIEIRPFKSRTHGIPDQETDGLLLPSATALSGFIDRTIRWKVRIGSAPKHSLEYFFMNSSLDHTEYTERFNTSCQVFPAKGTIFSSSINIELDVKEDGTVFPRLIYSTDRDDNALHFNKGEPFVIDMTTGDAHHAAQSYMGFDFGSSNSSLSYVSQASIDTYLSRRDDETWLKLNELVQTLPFPVSRPLQEYLSCAGRPDAEAKNLISTLESTMLFLGLAVYAYIREGGEQRRTKVIKPLLENKSSLGPLYNFLQSALEKSPGASELPLKLKELATDRYPQLKQAIDHLNDFKHDKAEAGDMAHFRNVLEQVLNISNQALFAWRFGYFEDVQKQPFSSEYGGIFRVAGNVTPFFEVIDYNGSHSFSSEQAFLINPTDGCALDLSPFIIWSAADHHESNAQRCLLFDIYNEKSKEVVFKCVGKKQGQVFTSGDSFFEGIKPLFDAHMQRDPFTEIIRGVEFSQREDR